MQYLWVQEEVASLKALLEKLHRRAGIMGKKRIRSVRLKMKGELRLGPDQKWLPMTAEEYYTTDPASFVWLGKVSMAPGFTVVARDKYCDGRGNMRIKLQSLITVTDAKGPEFDKASMVRYLNEMMWFPTAYLSDYIKWESINNRSARVTMSEKGLTVSAVCRFNEQDEMMDFIADRFDSATGKKQEWHTPILAYKDWPGFWIPSRGEALYKLESGDYSYIRGEITDIDFNVDTSY